MSEGRPHDDFWWERWTFAVMRQTPFGGSAIVCASGENGRGYFTATTLDRMIKMADETFRRLGTDLVWVFVPGTVEHYPDGSDTTRYAWPSEPPRVSSGS